jgi:hypothetical protein
LHAVQWSAGKTQYLKFLQTLSESAIIEVHPTNMSTVNLLISAYHRRETKRRRTNAPHSTRSELFLSFSSRLRFICRVVIQVRGRGNSFLASFFLHVLSPTASAAAMFTTAHAQESDCYDVLHSNDHDCSNCPNARPPAIQRERAQKGERRLQGAPRQQITKPN